MAAPAGLKASGGPMRVLVVSSLFPSPQFPHSGIFIREQLRALKEHCQIVGVVSPKPCYIPSRRILVRQKHWEGIPVYHVRYVMLPKLTVYLNWLSYFWTILRILRRQPQLQQIDIVHVHFAYPAGLAAVLLGRWLHKPVVLTVRGSDINVFPRDPVLRVLIAATLRAVNTVIAVSHDLQRKVTTLGIAAEKVHVIPNGVDLDRFTPLPKATMRRSLGLQGWKHIVLYVGALEAIKGVEYLLQAFRILLTQEPRSRTLLILVGQGTLQRRMQQRITDLGLTGHVLWQPSVPHEQIPRWMNACDVLCLPSVSEGRPNVIYEAMACGIPVVASAVGGIPEMICTTALGEVIPPRDSTALAVALRRALAQDWDPQVIRSYALSHSLAAYATRIVDVYRQWVPAAQAFEGVEHPEVQGFQGESVPREG